MLKLLDPNKHYFRIRAMRSPALLGEAIKFFSHSAEATHVEYITKKGTFIGAHFALNGKSDGIQERPEHYTDPVWDRWYALEVDAKTEAMIEADAYSHIGTRYDLADILGRLFNTSLHDGHKDICSEFMYQLSCRYPQITPDRKYMLNALPSRSYLITPDMYHLSPYLADNCYYCKIS